MCRRWSDLELSFCEEQRVDGRREGGVGVSSRREACGMAPIFPTAQSTRDAFFAFSVCPVRGLREGEGPGRVLQSAEHGQTLMMTGTLWVNVMAWREVW